MAKKKPAEQRTGDSSPPATDTVQGAIVPECQGVAVVNAAGQTVAVFPLAFPNSTLNRQGLGKWSRSSGVLNNPENWQRALSQAQLCLASPQMLAALQQFVAWAESPAGWSTQAPLAAALQAARDAIATAVVPGTVVLAVKKQLYYNLPFLPQMLAENVATDATLFAADVKQFSRLCDLRCWHGFINGEAWFWDCVRDGGNHGRDKLCDILRGWLRRYRQTGSRAKFIAESESGVGLAPRTVVRSVTTTWATSREDADLYQLARDVAPMFADQLLNESDEDFCERIADTTRDEFLQQAGDATAAPYFRFVVTIRR